VVAARPLRGELRVDCHRFTGGVERLRFSGQRLQCLRRQDQLLGEYLTKDRPLRGQVPVEGQVAFQLPQRLVRAAGLQHLVRVGLDADEGNEAGHGEGAEHDSRSGPYWPDQQAGSDSLRLLLP